MKPSFMNGVRQFFRYQYLCIFAKNYNFMQFINILFLFSDFLNKSLRKCLDPLKRKLWSFVQQYTHKFPTQACTHKYTKPNISGVYTQVHQAKYFKYATPNISGVYTQVHQAKYIKYATPNIPEVYTQVHQTK